MGEIVGGSRLFGFGLISILAVVALTLGVLAFVKYLSKQK